MHSTRNSIAKRLYTWTLSNANCRQLWQGRYWQAKNGLHEVACRECPRFVEAAVKCSVPFGSPARKCVTAAQEANLHSLDGMDLLEIGFGKHSIPKRLVREAGGTWTGIEPMLPRSKPAKLGAGGSGHVGAIPFAALTFDIVVGIQSIEHWGEPLPNSDLEMSHEQGLAEVFRVLRPGGRIYFCAPLYLHGHEMFIAGDIGRIRGLFDPLPWQDLVIELWRDQHEPLERFPAPAADYATWEKVVTSYPDDLLEDIRANRSVSIITIKARKPDS